MCLKVQGLKAKWGKSSGTNTMCLKVQGLKAKLGESSGTKSWFNPKKNYNK